MKFAPVALIAALVAAPAVAAPEKYALDAAHSQVVFSYNHLGFSNTYGMVGGITGEIMFDEADPAASTVAVSFPVRSMLTGWEARFTDMMGDNFFKAADDTAMVTFASTAIEVTGDKAANITGDLTMNGVTKPVTIAATLIQSGTHPMANAPWVGFTGTTTLLRSDFNVGAFAPAVGDEVQIMISIEAGQAAE